jgi:hypothetical protein
MALGSGGTTCFAVLRNSASYICGFNNIEAVVTSLPQMGIVARRQDKSGREFHESHQSFYLVKFVEWVAAREERAPGAS